MISLGVAVLAAPGEPLAICLERLNDAVDEIVVFTWDDAQVEVAIEYQARVIKVPPIRHVELIREDMQQVMSTDWVLLLDPDEVLEHGAILSFRRFAENAEPDIVGFWVPYHMLFLGEELYHSFPSIKQMRLFRRGRVRHEVNIHSVPIPINGRYAYLADMTPGIEHHFVTDIGQRFERHLLWAKIEAEELDQAGIQILDPMYIVEKGLEEFKHYAVHQHGLHDGCKGLVNALMHSWKRIATLCFLWELQQAKNMPIEPIKYWESIIETLKLPKPENATQAMERKD